MINSPALPHLEDLRYALVREHYSLRGSIGLLSQAKEAYADEQRAESSTGGDQADVASDVVEQSLDLTLERIEWRRLADVEAALRRLDAGTYGVCDRCNQVITMERLMAIPWTRYCLRCSTMQPSGNRYPSPEINRRRLAMTDPNTHPSTIREEVRVRGGQVLDKVSELIAKGNVQSLIVKHDGKVIVEIPLTIGVIGSLLAPQLAALGAIAALVTECTIEIVRTSE